MSALCGCPIIECVYCLGCARWVWNKCLYTAGRESENWGLASAGEFEPITRLSRFILAVYEDDLQNPIWAPPGGYGINPDWVVLRKNYEETEGRVSPYIIYLDQKNEDIVLAIRGLNLGKESDYLLLLDDKLGQTKFDGGYVHTGLLKAAEWVLEAECEILRELVERHPNYTLTFAGHSLGAGVVTLLTMLVAKNRERFGNIDRERIRCFAYAPTRCISLNLAVRYADVINSVVLQDTCTLEENMLQDPRRLYAPGRLYHIIVRQPFRFGKFPPVVRTAVPVDGRFEHMVLSCNILSDHSIVLIERESQRAFEIMLEKEKIMDIPPTQRMERQTSLAKEHSEEHRAALQRAVALDVPDACWPSAYGTFDETEGREGADRSHGKYSFMSSKRGRESWDGLVVRLFDTDESGHMVLKKS
ncbi:hypothetical protein RJ639_010617 [Escallonia herrerae]|uniref:Alpha/beta-Hydrolases superfamily protein n=1 Tax=Escallonia herrerae TaxID=1293975 RepID=A0AA89ATF0_9ASTE|nr:hypothetical protein RJ639_010617 [Escallonia herrerae]